MDTYTFTKNHTLISKGVAMILMLILHLFYWQDYEQYTAPIILPNGHSIPWTIGSIGNICVSMFLFLSGYGMYYVQKKIKNFSFRNAGIRIKNIWIQYAVITVTIVALGVTFGIGEYDFKNVMLNVFALDYSYNKFAWFVITYIVIILVFPVVNRFYKRMSLPMEVIGVIGIKVLITIINYVLQSHFKVNTIIYKVCIEPFMFLPVFLIGYICAKHFIFEKIIKELNEKVPKYKKMVLSMILAAVVVFIIFVPNTIFDNITAPIICFTVSYIFYENVIGKVFISLGKHATNMWLIHYPIMVTFIPKIIFFPRYWLFILLWIIIIMLPICYILDWIFIKFKLRG